MSSEAAVSSDSPTPDLDRFLRVLRRRMVALHVLERCGLGVLGACGIALVLLPILLWRHQPAIGFSLITLCLGGAFGVVWGLLTRPTLLGATIQADRQLDLADLLSTALAAGGRRADDPWTRTIQALADARCRELSPSSIVLNHLGAQAWGGIGLGSALVLTLSLLGTSATLSEAHQTGLSIGADNRPNPIDATASDPAPDPVGRSVADDGEGTSVPSSHDDQHAGRQATGKDLGTWKGSENDATGATGNAGVGAGRAETEGGALEPFGDPVARREPAIGSTARFAAGDGVTSAPSGASDPHGSGRVNDNPDHTPSAPPWESSLWPARQQAAADTVRNNQVPPEYHEMVREYFNR